MKTEHKYAQALRWIAGGENLQIRWGKDPRWMELPERNEIVMDEILRGAGQYEFRIKPRTVKIGNREVEAPVLEPAKGQELWYTVADGTSHRLDGLVQTYISDAIRYGRAFASREAAEAANEAVAALLRGEA